VFDLQEMSCAVDFIQLYAVQVLQIKANLFRENVLEDEAVDAGRDFDAVSGLPQQIADEIEDGFFDGIDDDLYNKMITPPCSMAFDS
jgi:hypothetical protein